MTYLRKQLDIAVHRGDRVGIVATLRRLQLRPITVALLTETKVGITVAALKQHDDTEVAGMARALVRQWKSLVKESERKRKREREEAKAAAAASAKQSKTAGSAPGSATAAVTDDKNVGSAAAASAAAVRGKVLGGDDDVRARAIKILRDSIGAHRRPTYTPEKKNKDILKKETSSSMEAPGTSTATTTTEVKNNAAGSAEDDEDEDDICAWDAARAVESALLASERFLTGGTYRSRLRALAAALRREENRDTVLHLRDARELDEKKKTAKKEKEKDGGRRRTMMITNPTARKTRIPFPKLLMRTE